MAARKGQPKVGGRKKGTPNKRDAAIAQRILDFGCDPFDVLAQMAAGKLPCSTCRGKGRTKYQPARGNEPGERTCESCWGSGLETVSPRDRGWAAGELANYIAPKLKAVEHSGTVELESAVQVLRRRLARLDEAEAPSAVVQ